MDNENEEDFYNVTIDALSLKTKNCISSLLNPIKVIPTTKGLPRDWQGLAELVGIDGAQIPDLQTKSDKAQEILFMWKRINKENCTIKQLMHNLEELDRFDILDDAAEYIVEDINNYKERLSSNFQDNTIICNGDVDILTVDDASRIRQGLSPQKYDAFVLFAEDDIAFATEVIDTMEKQYYLKFCVKDRDMVGGTVESDAIIKLITERCNRLIVIISDAFIYSPWHKFFLTFAQKLGIEQKQRKIIPCRYSCCQVPQELSCYYILDYQRTSKLYNFWEKLNNSITTADITSRNLERSKSQTNHQIETNSILPNQQVKPKRESVKFESNLNAKLPTPPNTPIEIEASSSGNMSVTEETKDGKAKLSCLLKLKSFLGVKVNRSHSDVTSKDKKKFWSRHVKSKVAVAN